MHELNTSRIGTLRLWLRVIAATTAILALVSGGALAQDDAKGSGITPVELSSIPAARQADRVVIITVEGAIDRVTSMSVVRRIEAAEKAGFDAMVIEVNSPGGELGAVLEISNAIKGSAISNSVAWVNTDAYSGGAIIALACREIITSSPASFGDAFIITFGTGGLRALSPDERTKLLPPLMADVTDSARRSGYDEFLVQAIVADGIELWQVEDIATGQQLAISEQEYGFLFDGEPIRGRPVLSQVTGGVQTYRDTDGSGTDDGETTDTETTDTEEGSDEDINEDESGAGDGETAEGVPQGEEEDLNAFRPASETLEDVAREFDSSERSLELTLQNKSQRVLITPADKGKYRLIGYITDGSSAIVMREDQLDDFGFSSGIVNNDEELTAFFGAKKLTRVRESPTERIVRFMIHPLVKFVLIALFLVAVGVEMLTGGTGIAGAVALGALALLVGPSALMGLSGWWQLIAIVAGILCLMIEVFVIPGFGLFGVVGILALFGGLIGTFVSGGGSMSSPQTQQQLMNGSVIVLLSFVTASIFWWLFVRKAQDLPIFKKLILNDIPASPMGSQRSLLHAIVMDDGSVRVGSVGVTTTALHPIGQADFNGVLHDVFSAFGTIDRGTTVRVTQVSRMRIEVEAIPKHATRAQDDKTPEGDDETHGGQA